MSNLNHQMTFREVQQFIAKIDPKWIDTPMLSQDMRTGEYFGFSGFRTVDEGDNDPPPDPGQPVIDRKRR